MRKLDLFKLVLIGVLIASSAFASQKGENRIIDGDFEADETGKRPEKWEVAKGG